MRLRWRGAHRVRRKRESGSTSSGKAANCRNFNGSGAWPPSGNPKPESSDQAGRGLRPIARLTMRAVKRLRRTRDSSSGLRLSFSANADSSFVKLLQGYSAADKWKNVNGQTFGFEQQHGIRADLFPMHELTWYLTARHISCSNCGVCVSVRRISPIVQYSATPPIAETHCNST